MPRLILYINCRIICCANQRPPRKRGRKKKKKGDSTPPNTQSQSQQGPLGRQPGDARSVRDEGD